MFTSRAEYRLALREDNARDRLSDYARKLGLIDDAEHAGYRELASATEAAEERLSAARVAVAELGTLGERLRGTPRVSLRRLLQQPNINIEDAVQVVRRGDPGFPFDDTVLRRAAIRIRYEGYLEKQQREIAKFRKLERVPIPDSFTYEGVRGLKREAQEKFLRFRPRSLGQAGRIEGVSPGDIAVLSVYLKRHGVVFP